MIFCEKLVRILERHCNYIDSSIFEEDNYWYMGQAEEGFIEKELKVERSIVRRLGWLGELGVFIKSVIEPERTGYFNQFNAKERVRNELLEKSFKKKYGEKFKFKELHDEVNMMLDNHKGAKEIQDVMQKNYEDKGVSCADLKALQDLVTFEHQVEHEKQWYKG